MKKILILFSLILIFLVTITTPTKKVNADDTPCEVSITPVEEYKDKSWSFPDNNNLIWFNINLIGTATNNVVVYYRTYDISAIAMEGDYTHTDSSVTFSNESNTSRLLAVEAGSIDFGLLDSSGEVRTRSFGIEIYDVKGTASISNENKIDCMIGYSSTRTISSTSEHLNSSHYVDYESIHKSETFNSPEFDNNGSWNKYFDFSKDPLFVYWKQTYIEPGEAYLYANYDGIIDDWGFNLYKSHTYLVNNKGDIVVGLDTHGYYDNHRLNPILVHHGDYRSWYDKKYNKQGHIRYHEDFLCDCGNCDHYNSFFYRVESDPIYTLSFWTEGGFDRCIKDFNIYSTLIDPKAPVIEDVYNDTVYYNNNMRIKMNVRFSEKIHLADDTKNLPYLNVRLNNDNVIQIPLSNYDLCKGTDTLSFEISIADVDYDGHISTLTVESIGNANNICDYGGFFIDKDSKTKEAIFLNNTYQGGQINKKIDVNLQSFVPTITMTPNTSGYQRQHSVTLELSGVSADSVKIKYTWSTSNEIPTEYEYQSDIANGTKIITENSLDGPQYLHVKAETNMNKVFYTCLESPLFFDNSPPKTTFSCTGNFKQREYVISVDDISGDSSSGLNYVYMVYRPKGEDVYITKCIADLTGGKKKTQHNMTYTVKAADVGIGTNDFNEVEIGFYATDAIGNYNEDFGSICEIVQFDTRNIFSSEIKGVSSNSDAEILLKHNNTFVVAKNTSDIVLDFANIDSETYEGLTPLIHSFVSVKTGEEFILNVDSSGEVSSLDFSNVPVGYYKFIMKVHTDVEDILSEEYYIYITHGSEDTTNYLNTFDQYVLKNYVYQLSSDNPYFYYLDTAGTITQEPYATKTNPATFSSKDIAYNYVYYKELSDLYAVRINKELADFLNSDVTSYFKAPGEDTVAVEGQIWIRYKSPNWTYQGTNNMWVYYCYNSSTINPSNFTIDVIGSSLPTLLADALVSVTEYICSFGEYRYLVGSEYTDKYGAPTLLSSQIFPDELTINSSICGTNFKYTATYLGDKNIKKSTVNVKNEPYVLATNYVVYSDSYTNIYYRRANTNDVYIKAQLKEGITYKDMINADGIYEIVEATAEGCRQYYVYIDKEAPLIEMKWYDSLDNPNTLVLSEEHNGMYINATKASICEMTREVDDLAYVLLYKTSSKKLLQVITKEMLRKEVHLEDEHYTMYIYDRSGNYYIINLRIDSSELECELTEVPNEYLKITTNRDETQIKTFEVYCNNQLLTTTYSSSLKLTKSGTYYIKVVDWYGNEENFEYSFSYDLPTVTWRYEIDGETYVYTGDNEEMTIQELGTNNFFIVSQGLLQFSIDGPYSFEFLGEEPEYTYTVINKRVKLKDVVSFSVKIYYTSQPNIYVIYNVSYDNVPPVIDASYIDNEYNTLEVDELYNSVLDKEEGYILVPECLDYEISSIKYNEIKNGDVFYSNLISVDLYDSVGIRDVYVYLDGELLLQKNSENLSTIILSRTGNYRIVAHDALGNEAVMEFSNVEQKTHEFSIDGVVDNLYGNSDSELTLYRDGEIHYLVDTGNEKNYLGLIVLNGVIYHKYYYVGIDSFGNNTVFIDNSKVLFEITENTSVNTYYDIYSDCCYYSVKYDENHNFTIRLNIYDDKEYYIQTRIEFSNHQIQLYKYNLSMLESKIDITDSDDNVVEYEEYIYLSNYFTIDENSIGLEVVDIKMYYSEINVFDSYNYIYIDNNFVSEKYDKVGFYKIVITMLQLIM